MNPLFFNPNYFSNVDGTPATPVQTSCGRGKNMQCGVGNAMGCPYSQCRNCPFNNTNSYNLGYGKCAMIMDGQKAKCPARNWHN